MRRAVMAFAGLALTSCAPVESPDSTGAPQRCNAGALQSLVGSHVGAVDFEAGVNVRIVCTTCPTTKDLRPDRLNIRFNQATGIIERVDCG